MTVLRGPPDDRSPADLLSFGVVNLDKPPGPSSHQLSGWLRDAVDDTLADRGVDTRIDRAAHAGTLDPKVTGCLPIMLGDATRLAQVFLEGLKEYVAVLECHGSIPGPQHGIIVVVTLRSCNIRLVVMINF